jgi:hypothetical protein
VRDHDGTVTILVPTCTTVPSIPKSVLRPMEEASFSEL